MEDRILEVIVAHWQQSVDRESYNGIPLRMMGADPKNLQFQTAVKTLIENGNICTPSLDSVNKHINRYGFGTVEQQVSSLDFSELHHTVFYPSERLVAEQIDLTSTDGKPYSREMALVRGEILPPVFFEVPVLDRYRDDPRYDVLFDDYVGRIRISSKFYETDQTPDRDKIVTDSLGLGFVIEDGILRPLVCAFRRYLHRLTPEHQQHWNSFLYLEDNAKMHPNFYKPTIEGDYYELNSAVSCLRSSVKYISEATSKIWGRSLFRDEFPQSLHKNLSTLMAPTQHCLNSFYEEAEKLLVSNLNEKFFNGLVIAETETERADGKVEVRRKGTLQMLEEFLLT